MTPELQHLVNLFRRYLLLPDPGPLLATLGAVAANRLPGVPVWLLLVGPPSCGKTQILMSLSLLLYVFLISQLTEAGLMSGSKQRRLNDER